MVASIQAAKDANYYLAFKELAFYYVTDAGEVGVWYAGAKSLGFDGIVNEHSLVAAFQGTSPDGKELVQLNQKRQPATDITFSVPKSLSSLWGVLESLHRHKIENIVMRAAMCGVDYFESEAIHTRRGKGGTLVEKAKGVWALCPHGTSRTLDPQLHVHALAINLCVRADGSTGAIRNNDLYQHKMAAGAIFRTQLAHLLKTELGLEIKENNWSFKIEGQRPKPFVMNKANEEKLLSQCLPKKRGCWTRLGPWPNLPLPLGPETKGLTYIASSPGKSPANATVSLKR